MCAPQPCHLVYSFTWGSSDDRQLHNSGMGAGGSGGNGSGMEDFSGGTQDKGTIAVDVVRVQPDGGVIVTVAEQANERRSAPAATCVIYSDTTTLCDPNKQVNSEELTVLRFMGTHFVDPASLDANKHWRVEHEGRVTTLADYTISKIDGSVMTIDEKRVVTESSARPRTVNFNSTLSYDFARAIPTAISEYSIERREQGEQYDTIKSQTVLTLVSPTAAVTSP